MRRPRHDLPVLLLIAALSLAGCSKRDSVVAPSGDPLGSAAYRVTEGPTIVAAPGARSGNYRRIWPHEDGRGWTYTLTSRSWSPSFPSTYPTNPENVPTLDMDAATAALGRAVDQANPETATGLYRLKFEGTITTMSGVTAQNLTETVSEGAAAARVLSSHRPSTRFLALLRRARPDIARRMGLPAASIASGPSDLPVQPTLLHGYAWEQSHQWIGTYGDLNQEIAWIFLTPDLRPGAEFTLQLVPDLADDVFLHARVLGWKRVETAAGTFHHAVEIAYLVDFGLAQATDEEGNPTGYYRAYLYGSTHYAAGVGPVRALERFHFVYDPDHVDTEIVTNLISTEAPALP